MNLYLISQSMNIGYDTYDSAVVAAPDEEMARYTHPRVWVTGRDWSGEPSQYEWEWAHPDQVAVTLLGVATADTGPGVICASFHAG